MSGRAARAAKQRKRQETQALKDQIGEILRRAVLWGILNDGATLDTSTLEQDIVNAVG